MNCYVMHTLKSSFIDLFHDIILCEVSYLVTLENLQMC